MSLFKTLVLKDSIKINATAENIWLFFYDLEDNYVDWHPKDHIMFSWIGEPMKSGSKWYAEEFAKGRKYKLRGTVGEVVQYEKIIFKYSFPMSLVSKGFEWHIEVKDSYSIFTAVSYLKAEGLMRKLSVLEGKNLDDLVAATKQHVKEEGENLKKILEKE